jgi:hypothetical protein
MSTHDPWLEHMERQKGVCDPLDMDEPDADEPTQIERLSRPKCDVIGPRERLEQLCSSAMSVYHISLCCRIKERIGHGEPLDVLLRDEWARRRFKLVPRQL